MKSKLYMLLLAATLGLAATAQTFRSAYFVHNSTSRHELNPAFLDSAYIGMPLILGGINVGMESNVALKHFIYDMKPSWQGYGEGGRTQTTFMHPEVNTQSFLNKLPATTRIGLQVKYQLGSVAFKGLGGTNLVELNLRSDTRFVAPKELFRFMKDPGGKTDYQITDLGLRSESMAELALGHAHGIGEQWRVGGKVKLLVGIAYADLDVDHINLHLDDDQWKVDGQIDGTLACGSTTLAYDDASHNYRQPDGTSTQRRRVNGIDEIKPGISGIGFAFDLGATYKPTPNLTLSASVSDLGLMRWSKAKRVSSAGTWTFDGFKNPVYCGGIDTGDNKIEDQLDAIGDDLTDLFSIYENEPAEENILKMLTTTVNVGADYALPIYDKLRIGFLYTGRYAGRYTWQQALLAATIQPWKWLEASINASMSSTGFSSGAVLNFRAPRFNFYIGTDHFFGKFNKQFIPINHGNANVSLGMSFPLH